MSLFVTPGFLKPLWMLKVCLSSRGGGRSADGREGICTGQLFSSGGSKKWKFWGAGKGSITYNELALTSVDILKIINKLKPTDLLSFLSSLL